MDTSSLVLYHLAGASLRVLSLALVAFAALWLARVRSASIRHAVWTVILGAMLLLPLLMAVAPALPVWIRSNPPAAVPAQALPAFSPGGVTQPVAVRPDWRQAGLALYLAILLAALVRLAASCLVVRRLLRSALPIREKHAVELLESAQISVPMAAGFLTPRILLPSTWREWSPEKLDTVLAHELAHVRRKDPQIALAAALNKCIFWFHPLAWYVERKLALLAEEAADDSTVLVLGDRRKYASTLLELAAAAQAGPGRLQWEAVAMAKPAQVRRRIDRILDETTRFSRSLSKGRWLALLLPGAAILYGAAALQVRTIQAPAAPEAHAAPSTPSQRWIEQDVVYLITETERATFLALTTDDERERFVEQFWLRRDPTPGTTQNEFKVEHYRRIAYANERFPAGRPGWRTDRGRIYITYGPPDERDEHPAGAAPYEIWRYRWLRGIGTNVELRFEDPAMTGEYGLVLHSRLNGPEAVPQPSRPQTAASSWFTCSVSVVAHPWEGADSFVAQVDVVFDGEQLPFQLKDGVETMVVSVYGRVTSSERRVTHVFADVLTVDRRGGGQPEYHKRVQLRSGSYILYLVVKDPASGRTESKELTFTVPQ